jgi:hypothetical protein
MADEYLELCHALWRSWEPDAVLLDRESGVFADVIRDRPDALMRSLRAMAQGQLMSSTYPERTVEAFWKQYPDQAPRPGDREKALRENMARVNWQNHLNGTADLSRDALMTHQWGAQKAKVWARMQENLLRIGDLPRKIDPHGFINNRFVADLNPFDREKTLAVPV